MPAETKLVFLLDIDNTLLDNDGFTADLGNHIEDVFGAEHRERYWGIYDKIRDEFGYADYLAALQFFRDGLDDDPDLLQMSQFLLEYPFANRVFPEALQTIQHLKTFSTPAILSDGDIVFQPRKAQRAGLWDAVEGRVMIYLHKEQMLDSVQRHFPARHYAMVDDKPHLLAKMKRVMGDKLTTIFVRQGHYAREAEGKPINPAPDVVIDRFKDLLTMDGRLWDAV
ncbi:HAD family hydrolase [Labrys monachus]|uniref:FMN phosphatase YigB (HAD superfamily) n=1 Tax=Labrys monachus TaxID=217067 RepID=A0ABU0FK73_9HYPH|nr:HAD family hydrolase [Labrys monachus]MDQ0394999.1 FMN phosphatase YigB (HAD superfamily) [Labrys monachus]